MMLFFKHIETTASEITKEQSVIINTVAGCRTQTYPIDFFQTFHVCYLQSSFSQSSSVLIFAGIK